MTTAQSAHPWLARFCIHLMGKFPSMSARTAIKHAVARYPDYAHLQPEHVAQLHAQAARADRWLEHAPKSVSHSL